MKVNLAFVLGFSFFAFSAGAPNCANPCEDLWVAKSCNKVQHCIDNEWTKLKPTGQTDNVCQICLDMVQEARTTLESKDMEDSLKQVFEGSCKLLVLQPVVDMCDKMVDQLIPELVAVLASELDPETVCTVAKLCNNAMFRTMQEESRECRSCQRFMSGSKDIMKSVSEEDFQQGLTSLCRNMGTFTDACYAAGSMYSGLLYNHTQMALNGKPCEATFICPSGSKEEIGPKSVEICPGCEDVIKSLVKQLTRVKSMEEYEKNFIKICTRLNFPLDVCSKLAKNKKLYHFLVEDRASISGLFCSKVVCPQKRSEEAPVWPLLPEQSLSLSFEGLEHAIMRAVGELIEEYKKKSVVSRIPHAELDCFTCKDLVKNITQSLKQEENKEMVMETLTELCSKLPEESKLKCREIQSIISRDSSPDEICTKMNYCPHSKEIKSISYGDVLENPIFFSPNVLSSLYDSDCKMCRKMSRALSNHIHTNNSNFVVCPFSQNLSECMQNFSPEISKAFAEYISTGKACSKLIPSCNADKTYSAPRKELNRCQCKAWGDAATTFLNSVNPEAILTDSFTDGCNDLAGDLREKCRAAMKEKSEEMLRNIAKVVSADEVCGDCRNDSTSLESMETTSELEKVPCKFCLLAVKTLLDQLENDKTQESIRHALKSLCKYFPEETRDTCQNLIDQYAEDLVDMIIADFSPSEICAKLRICKPKNTISESVVSSPIQNFDIGTNEIREDFVLQPTKKTSESTEVDSALLKRVHSAVQECAMCEALVQVISSHKNMLVKDYDFSGNSSMICRIVPRRKRKQCMSMVVSYGPSIVNLLVDQKVAPDDVCPKLTLCDPSMHAKVDMPVSVTEPSAEGDCMAGPSFWCASEENARKCGTYLHCRELVWKTAAPSN